MKRYLALIAMTILCAFSHIIYAQEAGTVQYPSVSFRAQKMDDGNYKWGWVPMARFTLNGPISNTATVSVEYTTPDGKTWVTDDCKFEDATYKNIKIEDCGDRDANKKTTYLTGNFGFKIKLNDELAGGSKVLMSGKLKIGKFLYNPNGEAMFKNQYLYYFDNDWRLPIGLVYTKSTSVYDPNEVSVVVEFWGKGNAFDDGYLQGFLFRNGTQVAKNGTSNLITEKAEQQNPFEYRQRSFSFNKKDLSAGDYELRVTMEGKLVRSLKFTLDNDGLPVANDIAKNSNMGVNYAVVPVSVVGTADGTWNKAAWQTETFWGNTLKGFTANP